MRRRFLNDPTLFLHFCDYLPFEEDLALYLNNIEFPLPKDDLYVIYTKFDCNWPSGSGEEIFFNINCGPSRPPGTMM
jgi:hypothetical protein